MKWINHILIAGSIAAVVSPSLVAPAIAGATAPDWMESLLKAVGRPVKHRTTTHVFTHWLIAGIATSFLWDFHGIFAAFCWGGFSHILTDGMTVSGVPFSPYSDRRFHLFGGRFRTGEPVEYAISAVIVMISITLNAMIGDSFAPYFYDWSGLYAEGMIDASEWKANRFRLM